MKGSAVEQGIVNLQGHQGKRAGDKDHGNNGQGVPQSFGRAGFRQAFRNEIAKQNAGAEPANGGEEDAVGVGGAAGAGEGGNE